MDIDIFLPGLLILLEGFSPVTAKQYNIFLTFQFGIMRHCTAAPSCWRLTGVPGIPYFADRQQLLDWFHGITNSTDWPLAKRLRLRQLDYRPYIWSLIYGMALLATDDFLYWQWLRALARIVPGLSHGPALAIILDQALEPNLASELALRLHKKAHPGGVTGSLLNNQTIRQITLNHGKTIRRRCRMRHR